jgi:hypothetical protein
MIDVLNRLAIIAKSKVSNSDSKKKEVTEKKIYKKTCFGVIKINTFSVN